MFCYYLQHRSYYKAGPESVIAHINQLNAIISQADEYDHFMKYRDFMKCAYDRKRTIQDFLNGQQVGGFVQTRLLPELFRRIKDIDPGFMGLKDMDLTCTRTTNAFLGPFFSTPFNRLLISYDDYSHFRLFYATQNVTGNRFACCCKIALKRIILGDIAIRNVRPLGKEAEQIFKDLQALNQYICDHWRKGPLDVRDVAAKSNITISDESETTKKSPRYKKLRYFIIPGLGGRFCFLHIKSGRGKRFHIYPDENNQIIYVPYIGSHLPTKKNP